MTQDLNQVVQLISSGKRFLLTCHRQPDADALGSMLGLAAALDVLGKGVVRYVPEALPTSLRYLPDTAAIQRTLDANATFDAVIVTDTAASSLLPAGIPPKEQRGPLVVVDHHRVHDGVGDIILRDTNAAATGEVVFALIEALGIKDLNRSIAVSLYAALVADTGGFRYPATSVHTVRVAARLMEAGADPWQAAYELFEGWSLERLRLLGRVLDTIELFEGGRLAVLTVSQELVNSVGADEEMVEGMVNYARMLRGVELGILIFERVAAGKPGGSGDRANGKPLTKVSLRSHGRVDVAAIASALGGGGHQAAAGATLGASLSETRALVLKCAKEALAETS